jgi:hypothetical protein
LKNKVVKDISIKNNFDPEKIVMIVNNFIAQEIKAKEGF